MSEKPPQSCGAPETQKEREPTRAVVCSLKMIDEMPTVDEEIRIDARAGEENGAASGLQVPRVLCASEVHRADEP